MMPVNMYDYIVIGGGSGGVASANRAAMHGAKVLLIESNHIGGTCVNVGCVPKKVMWYASELHEMITRDAASYGLTVAVQDFDFQKLVRERTQYIARLRELYRKGLADNRVTVVAAYATFVDEHTIQAGEQLYCAPHILIATGGRPKQLAIPGAEYALTSDDFFALRHLPKRAVLIGAGYVAAELAGTLCGLGVQTHWAFRHARPLRSFDRMLAEKLMQHYQEAGMVLLPETQPIAIKKLAAGDFEVQFANGQALVVDCVIQGVGRQPNTEKLGLAHTRVALTEQGYIQVDAFQNTTQAGIYALGDVIGKVDLTPVAIAAGRHLAERLFHGQTEAHLDYENIPTVIFTHPPIATIGLTEEAARKQYGAAAIKVYRSTFTPMYFALNTYRQTCDIKLICMQNDERIVGLHAIGLGVDEMLQGFAVAIKMGATKKDFDRTVAIHPTGAEEFVTMKKAKPAE